MSTKTITFERTYEASIGDLWDAWTTKDGLESWWGPEGFRVEVQTLDLCVGGRLHYDMIAASPEMVAVMRESGMPESHETHGTFVEVEEPKRLKICHLIDFIPGMDPYENNVVVEFFEDGNHTRMVITLDAHSTEEWTQQATAGWESQLTKLPAVLAKRKG